MKLTRTTSKAKEADLKIIVAQGEAILARLELIDHKIEEERRLREEHNRVDRTE